MLHVRGVPMQGVCRSKGEAGGAANSPPAAHTSPKPALDIPDTKHYRKHWKSSEFTSGMYNVHASAQLIFDECFPFQFDLAKEVTEPGLSSLKERKMTKIFKKDCELGSCD